MGLYSEYPHAMHMQILMILLVFVFVPLLAITLVTSNPWVMIVGYPIYMLLNGINEVLYKRYK